MVTLLINMFLYWIGAFSKRESDSEGRRYPSASAASLDREVPPDYTAGTLCLVILQCGSLLSVSKQSKWQLREGLHFLTVCSETLLSVPDQ